MDSIFLRAVAAVMLPLISGTAAAENAITPPATWSFESGMDGFSIINADPSTATFEYSGWRKCIEYSVTYGEDTDDYFLLPMMTLKSGVMYQVTYSAYASWYRFDWNPALTWMIGTEPETDKLAETVVSTVAFESSYEPGTFTFSFSVSHDGDYYIASRLTADEAQGSGSFYISRISIDGGMPTNAPEPPQLDVTPMIREGSLAMDVSLALPDKRLDGSMITGMIEYSVCNETGRFNRSGSGNPGDVITLTDTECSSEGETYTAFAISEGNPGKVAAVTCIPEFDRPLAPANLHVVPAQYEVEISWDPVVAGASGGLFIPSDVVYTVQRSDRAVIAERTNSTCVIDTPPFPTSGQTAFSYTVTAYNNAASYIGASSESQICIIGSPYSDSFTESFAGGKVATTAWTYGPDNALNSAWQPTTASYSSPYCNGDADGDGGFLIYNPSYYDGTVYYSPVIELPAAESPTLELCIFRYSAVPDTPLVKLYIIQGCTKIPVSDGELSFSSDADYWDRIILQLPAQTSESPFRILFEGMKPNGKTYKALIDTIKVYDRPSCDASVSDIHVPDRLMPGDSVSINVEAYNNGYSNLDDVQVLLDVDGKSFASPSFSMLPGEACGQTFNIHITPFMAGTESLVSATVIAPGDVKESNNTKIVRIPILEHHLPVSTVVKAEHKEEGTSIIWTAPIIDEAPYSEDVTESFEDWTVGSADPCKGWIFIDADKNDKNGLAGINAGMQYAFFIADKFSTSSMASIETPDGKNAIVTTRNADWSVTDSWLVSPPFDPGHEVSFMASGIGFRGLDTAAFEVGYFPADKTDPEGFVKVQDVETNGYSWESVSLTFPEEATRFAIHAADVQTNAYAFDLFKFHAIVDIPELIGYNLWRNGECIASLEADELSFIDHGVDRTRDNVYHISCVYTPSREAMEPRGFTLKAEAPADAESVLAPDVEYSLRGRILTSSMPFDIFNIDGVRIGRVEPESEQLLQQGIYILQSKSSIHKLIVE